ncbi:fragile X mental retardation 1 neighbor protein [Grammomys surdaster]|uniref:fragile X mental retardation 1 neighbor protein n=1 Tax=Grammomys surdaster TaxID=491861 RepID=UPI0010A0BEDD|nr:fragile X mental retardation 1 neighbor protein [Grammomys surdaster]
MPSDLRPRQGRNRSKSRAYRGARSKITAADTGYRGETPVLKMYRGVPSSAQGNNMAAAPRFGFWTLVSRCLQNFWAQRHLGLLLLLLWTLVILYSLTPKAKFSWLGDSVELGPQLESMLDFFFPTTCFIRDNQEVLACNNQPYLTKSECLRAKCCFSSSGNKIRCHTPLRDKPTQMLRVFGVVVIIMVILGFLPVYCCSFCRRRKRMNRMLKVLKKQKTKMKKEPKGWKASEERALLSS